MNILNNVSMDLRYPKRLSFYPDQKKAGFHNYAQKFKGFNLSDDLLNLCSFCTVESETTVSFSNKTVLILTLFGKTSNRVTSISLTNRPIQLPLKTSQLKAIPNIDTHKDKIRFPVSGFRK